MVTYGKVLEDVLKELCGDVHGVAVKTKEGLVPVNISDKYRGGPIHFSITAAGGKENWFEYNTGKLIPL